MHPDVCRQTARDDLNLAVCAVVLAVRRLKDKTTAVGQPLLEGCKSLVLYFVVLITARQFIERIHQCLSIVGGRRCVPVSSIVIVKGMIASAVARLGYRAGQLVGPTPKSCAGASI